MIPLKQQIALIPFSIEHWYSPLHRALVLVNAYKCAKFQLPGSISYVDMEGSKKIGAADLLRRALAGKLLHVAIIPANGYQRTKFQLSR